MGQAYAYKKIDAFTAGESLGNPAACIYLEPGQALTEAEMQRIALRHKGFVSEVIYCSREGGEIRLRYYSSECEVDFCGHGTIACMHQLIGSSPELLRQEEITIRTHRKGWLTVYNRILERDAVFVAAPQPVFIGTDVSREAVCGALGVSAQALHHALPFDVIDAGLRTLIVPLRDLETACSLFPEEGRLRDFCLRRDIDIVLIFSMEAGAGHIAHTRVFAPRFGYLEDPATGSGNSAFGYYMLKNGLWDRRGCVIGQGGSDRVHNEVQLSCRDGAVLFGGGSTLCVDGIYYVN